MSDAERELGSLLVYNPLHTAMVQAALGHAEVPHQVR
jgi:hypothetical protein